MFQLLRQVWHHIADFLVNINLHISSTNTDGQWIDAVLDPPEMTGRQLAIELHHKPLCHALTSYMCWHLVITLLHTSGYDQTTADSRQCSRMLHTSIYDQTTTDILQLTAEKD